MLKPPAPAYSCTRSPDCTVFDVMAQYDADLERNQRGCAPPQFSHRRNDKMSARYREKRIKIADDLEDVPDDVWWEQNARDGSRSHAEAQRLAIEGSIQPEQTADPVQREPEAELNRREFRSDQNQQRKAGAPIRHFRVDDPDGL